MLARGDAEEFWDLEELLAQLQALLDRASIEQRLAVLRSLRKEFPVHPVEAEWNTSAEQILEAISRSGDLTQRGIRGILAEASFFTTVLPALLANGWQDLSSAGGVQFDAKIQDAVGAERIQVKLQRQKAHRPMLGSEAPKYAGFAHDRLRCGNAEDPCRQEGGQGSRKEGWQEERQGEKEDRRKGDPSLSVR